MEQRFFASLSLAPSLRLLRLFLKNRSTLLFARRRQGSAGSESMIITWNKDSLLGRRLETEILEKEHQQGQPRCRVRNQRLRLQRRKLSQRTVPTSSKTFLAL